MNRTWRRCWRRIETGWDSFSWYAGYLAFVALRPLRHLARRVESAWIRLSCCLDSLVTWRPLRHLGRRVEAGWIRFSWSLGFVVSLVVRPWRRLGRFLVVGWQSANFRYLLAGLPALLAVGGVCTLALMAGFASSQDLASQYRQETARRFQAKDYEGAEIGFERLALLDGERPETRYGLALTLEALRQNERAAALLDDLAPLDRQGYAPAHFWHACRLLAAADPPAQTLRAAEVHLLRTLQGQPDNSLAHALLGRLLVAAGQLDQAEPHLVKGLESQPELRLMLARLYAARGKKELARTEAELAVRFFRHQAETDVDNHQARLHWADALVLLEDFAGAVAVLQRELPGSQEQSYRQALAGVYGAWSDALGRDARATPGDRLALLEQGLRYDGGNVDLLQRLFPLTRLRGVEAENARAALQKVLAQGKAPATVHVLLGMDAWERGKTTDARQHWEQAYQLAPQMAVAANNLAWLLAHAEPPDLPWALALVNSALERDPNQASFRDTRGRILAKMGRWQQALTDLQAVLAERPNNPQLHRVLAEVYQHLGLADMAAVHIRLAEAKSR